MTFQERPSDCPPDKGQPRYRGKEWVSREGGEAARGAYRRVEPLAAISLAIGLLAFVPMFGWPMIVVPIAGVGLGLFALRQILNFPGQKTGQGLAIAGVVLSVVLGIVGCGFNYFYVHGAPIGYSVITFQEMQPDKDLEEIIPKKILELDGKFVFIKGYMYPGRRSTCIQQFVLVPSQWHCKFCQRDLASTEMLKVKMVSDEMADYSSHPVGVGGKLKINKREALRPFGGMPYELEADVFRD